MNLQEIIPVCILATALLTLSIHFYKNKSEFNNKVKYVIIALIFLISSVCIYTFVNNLFDNSSKSKINTSEIDQTYVDSNLSSAVSIFIPSIFTSIPLDEMDSLKGWKIRPREVANGTFHLAENNNYKAIEIDYNLGPNTAFVMSKRKGFSVFGEDINKVNEIGVLFKGNGSINSLELELTDQDGKCFGKKWSDVTGEENWTYLTVKIPDLKCWGCTCKDENEIIDLSKVVAFGFAISDKAGEEGGSGEVTITRLTGFKNRIYSVPNLSSIISIFTRFFTRITLDEMDNLKGWKIQPREGAYGTFHLAENNNYKAIEIDYNLGPNTAFVMSKRKGFSVFGEDINKVNEIGVLFKANGSINSLELELTDQDGKCFGKKWSDVTGEENWTYLTVKVPDLKCWGCTCKDENEIIDLSKVVAFGLAISDKAGEEGGSGEVTIAGLTGFY